MKKHLFILAGLLAFTATNYAEAKAVKLGRSTLITQGNPNVVNTGTSINTGCNDGECKKSDGTCVSVSNYSCPTGQTPFSNNGMCDCQTNPCTGSNKCLDNGNCILVSNYTGCTSGTQTPIRKSDGKCGCQNNGCGDGSCLNEEGNCVTLSEYQTQCDEGYIAVSNNNQCECVANNYCAGVLCNSGYTPQAEPAGCHCVAEPEPPAETCPFNDMIYHPVNHACVYATYDYLCDITDIIDEKEYCLFCRDGYYVSTYFGCKSCAEAGVEHCRICRNLGCDDEDDNVVCIICESGYTLMSDGTCMR